MRADAVDVLPHAGICDPLPFLPLTVHKVLADDSVLFAGVVPGMSSFEDVAPADREEYVKLVARQLDAKQLGLVQKAKAGGKVIAVGKPGGKRQRAVWHGRRVSAAAARPPKPRSLTSPTALTYWECRPGHKIRCSKRDASCWFDQLALPEPLWRWMGRPHVTLHELQIVAGMTSSQVQDAILPGEVGDSSCYFSVSLTWPMGVAWSSFVAQEFLFHTCNAAGLSGEMTLACEMPT